MGPGLERVGEGQGSVVREPLIVPDVNVAAAEVKENEGKDGLPGSVKCWETRSTEKRGEYG